MACAGVFTIAAMTAGAVIKNLTESYVSAHD